MGLLSEKILGNWFDATEDDVAVAIFSETSRKAQENLNKGKLSDSKAAAYNKLQVHTASITEQALKQGKIVLTSISCYSVISTIILTLHPSTRPTGKAIIFGTLSELENSGFKSHIQSTKQCYFVPVNEVKYSKEETEAATKAYEDYKQSVKSKLEEDPDAEIEEELWVPTQSLPKMIAWKFISDVVDGAYIICDSYRALYSPKNTLIRELLNAGITAFVYKGKAKPVELTSIVDASKIRAKVKVFQDRDIVQYDSQEIYNILGGISKKLKPKAINLVADISDEAIAECDKQEDNAMYSATKIRSIGTGKVVGIIASYLTTNSIEHFKGKAESILEPDFANDTPTEIASLKDVVPQEYFSQIGNIISENLDSGNTVVIPADKAYGVAALSVAQQYLKKNHSVQGQVVILEGNVDYDTPEGNEMSDILEEMEKYDKVGFIKFNKVKFKATIPNAKAFNEDGSLKKGEEAESKVSLPVSNVIANILTTVCDTIIMLKANVGSIHSNAVYYFAKDKKVSVKEYVLKQGLFRVAASTPDYKDDPKKNAVKEITPDKEIMDIFVQASSDVQTF